MKVTEECGWKGGWLGVVDGLTDHYGRLIV